MSQPLGRVGGFTLIEVLVALVIVGVALPALLLQVMTQVDATTAIRDRTLAHWVAQNKLAQLRLGQLRLDQRTQGALILNKRGGEETMAEVDWHWEVDREPTEVKGLTRISISVGLKDQPPVHELLAFLHE
jgi:general secretion pathway protein I